MDFHSLLAASLNARALMLPHSRISESDNVRGRNKGNLSFKVLLTVLRIGQTPFFTKQRTIVASSAAHLPNRDATVHADHSAVGAAGLVFRSPLSPTGIIMQAHVTHIY